MKHKIGFCAKFAAAALVTFMCFDIYFRTTEISLPSVMIDDPVLGRAFRPNARAALVQEGFHMDRVNEYGLLGPAYPLERTEGTVRVALVGDSFVEGAQVFPKWNLRSVLERELSRLAGRRVEVLNFGLTGHTLRTMYASNKDLVARFQPDITLLFVVGESFSATDYSMGPKCYLDEDGNLKVSYDFAKSKTFQRKTRLRFTREFGSFQVLQAALGRYRLGHSRRILLGKLAPRERAEKESPQNPGKDRYFDLNKAVIREFGRLNRSGESRIIIVGRRNVPPHYVPVIKEAGLTYIDLRPELEELERSGSDPYYWPHIKIRGHWNHEGHRFVGESLARHLSELERPKTRG